jgi:hypothetical protein
LLVAPEHTRIENWAAKSHSRVTVSEAARPT